MGDTEDVENTDCKGSEASLKYPDCSVPGAPGPQARSPDCPDSTSDLVADPSPPSPSSSPHVTSSQSLAYGSVCDDEEADLKESELEHETTVSGDNLVSETDVEEEIIDGSGILGLHSAANVVSAVNRADDLGILTGIEKKCYVPLKNWGVYLSSSKCYCIKCQTLFPTENAIAAHRMTDHSFLMETNVAGSRQRPGSDRENSSHTCPHCPAKFTMSSNMIRHVRNIHRAEASPSAPNPAPDTEDPIAPIEDLGSRASMVDDVPVKTKLCQICKAAFFDPDKLIEHIYKHTKEGPQTPKHDCDFCEETFAHKSSLERHLWSHARSRHSRPRTSTGGAKEAVDGSESAASASPAGPRARVASVASRPIDNSPLESENSTVPSGESLPGASSESAASASPLKSRVRSSAATSRTINKCLLESESSTMPSSASGDSMIPPSAAGNTYKKCPVCALLLFSKHTYNHHMSVVHKRRPGALPPNTAATTTCPHCGIFYDSVHRYNVHIRNSHVVYSCMKCKAKCTGAYKFHAHKTLCREKSNARNLAAADTAGSTLKNSILKVQQVFKCLMCLISFPNRTAGRMHCRSRHPGAPSSVIVQNPQKLILKKASPSGVPEPQKRKANGPRARVEAKDTKENLLTLLQCHLCKHHFVTASGLHRHINNGEACEKVDTRVCNLCGLIFTKQSIRGHIQQHRMSDRRLAAWDFAVKTASGAPVVFDRREAVAHLPRCQRCRVTFQTRAGVCKNQCYDVKTIRCKPCDATFSNTAYNCHLFLHKRKNSSAPAAATEKPSKKSDDEEESKENKVEKKAPEAHLTVLRCEKCKIHVNRGGGAISSHRTTNCNILMPKIICLQCGLTFTATSIGRHRALHKRSVTPLTMASFTILGMSDGKPVPPEPCPFPACARCGVRAESNAAAFHRFPADCKKVSATRCRTCQLTFTAAAFPLHVGYYACESAPKRKLVKTKLEQTKLDSVKPRVPPEERKSDEMTEILDSCTKKPHESWTQLYRCRECVTVVDSYDEVVEHCELHKEHGFESNAFMCHVCDLRFENASFVRHKELHFSRPGLDCSSFEVMDYRPAQYDTRSWIVYKYTFTGDKIAYELLQPGPERHTLYRCDCGKHCAGRVAAYRHSMSAENCLEPPETCGDCELPFQRSSLEVHAADHRNHPHLAADNCRIFRFARTDRIDPPPRSNPLKRKLGAPGEAKSSKNNPRATLYKCAKCDAHFMSKRMCYAHLHRRASAHMRHLHTTCDSCGLLFTRKSWKNHFLLHHQKKKISRDDFEVQTVGIKMQSDSNAILPLKRSLKSTFNKNVTQSTLFKCGKCNAHFFTEVQAMKHMYRTDIDHTGHHLKVCHICRFEFTQNVWKLHYQLHHENNKFNHINFQVKTVVYKNKTYKRREIKTQEPLKGTKQSVTRFTLYKCGKCNANFLTEAQARKHFYRPEKHHSQDNIVVCTTCSLHFKRSLLKQHTTLHHKQQKHNRADFKVITVTFKGTADPRSAGLAPKKSPKMLKPSALPSSEQIKAEVRNVYANELKATTPTLYKCNECGVHNIKKSQMGKHWDRCKNARVTPRIKHHRRTCLDCNILFTSRGWKHHRILHHQLMHCARSDFTIRVMRGSDVVSVEPATTRHLTQKNKIVLGSTVKKAAKSAAGLERMRKDQRKTGIFTNKIVSSNPTSVNKRRIIHTVFKCTACTVCYLMYRSIHSHISRHDRIVPSEKCRLCPLVFTKKVMPNHQRLHHKDGRVDEYKVVEIAPKNVESKQGHVAGATELMEAHKKCEMADTTSHLVVRTSNSVYEDVEFLDDDVIECS